MYHHVKKLMFTVRVDAPDPKFGNMLLEQFGGANGELAAAMQYSIQGLNCKDAERKDLLMDIGTEELSHLEIVGTLARMHLAPMKFKREAAEADPLIAIAGGGARETVTDSPPIHAESSEPGDGEMIQELLVDQLRDILHGEKQVQKALPKMVKAAHSQQLQQLFETHLEETEAQIERIEECFGVLGIQPRAKACKGMMGIVEEGDEVIADGKTKDEIAADLAL